MTEQVTLFGEDRNLVGVLTLPGSQCPPSSTAYLLLNAGVIHRVGPNRHNVLLARRLARAGIVALRFDISGIGDSRATRKPLPFEDQAVADIRAAMDHLQATQLMQHFVLVGLCSGADNALATARVDSRVRGLVLIDPHAYPTLRSKMRSLLLRLSSRRHLTRYLRRRTGTIVSRLTMSRKPCSSMDAGVQPTMRFVRQAPPLADFVAGLRMVLDRGGNMMIVYSGGNVRRFNYQNQLDDVLRPFGLAGAIRCHFFPGADHNFTELSEGTQLLDTIATWASSTA